MSWSDAIGDRVQQDITEQVIEDVLIPEVPADAAGQCLGVLSTGLRCAGDARHMVTDNGRPYALCDRCWAEPPDHYVAARAATRQAPKRPDPNARRGWREEKK